MNETVYGPSFLQGQRASQGSNIQVPYSEHMNLGDLSKNTRSFFLDGENFQKIDISYQIPNSDINADDVYKPSLHEIGMETSKLMA